MMSRLMCSCAGDIRLYSAIINGYEQQAACVCECVCGGGSCVVEIVDCWFQTPLPSQDSSANWLISLRPSSHPRIHGSLVQVTSSGWETRSEKRHVPWQWHVSHIDKTHSLVSENSQWISILCPSSTQIQLCVFLWSLCKEKVMGFNKGFGDRMATQGIYLKGDCFFLAASGFWLHTLSPWYFLLAAVPFTLSLHPVLCPSGPDSFNEIFSSGLCKSNDTADFHSNVFLDSTARNIHIVFSHMNVRTAVQSCLVLGTVGLAIIGKVRQRKQIKSGCVAAERNGRLIIE